MLPFVVSVAAAAVITAVILTSAGHRAGSKSGSATDPTEMRFVRVEPGTFIMGDPAEAATTTTDFVHQVTLTLPFLMGTYCVTVKQFARFVAETGYRTSAEKAGRAQGPAVRNYQWLPGVNWRNAWPNLPDSMPVVAVGWFDATAFCKWLGRAIGRKVRLPTEAEWEYACRAGTNTPFNVPGPLQDVGWFGGNSGDRLFDGQSLAERSNAAYYAKVFAEHSRPHPVGGKKPNRWGLYDMHGNVWEWCFDAVGPYPAMSVTNPTGPVIRKPDWRRARGGDWYDPPSIGTSFNRGWWHPTVGYTHIGFRVVQEL